MPRSVDLPVLLLVVSPSHSEPAADALSAVLRATTANLPQC